MLDWSTPGVKLVSSQHQTDGAFTLELLTTSRRQVSLAGRSCIFFLVLAASNVVTKLNCLQVLKGNVCQDLLGVLVLLPLVPLV